MSIWVNSQPGSSIAEIGEKNKIFRSFESQEDLQNVNDYKRLHVTTAGERFEAPVGSGC